MSSETIELGRQATNVIKSHLAGQVTYDKMIGVLRGIPWGSTTSSGGDWMTAADVPIPDGPLLNGVLSGAGVTDEMANRILDDLE